MKEHAKRVLLGRFYENVAILAALFEGRLNFGSSEANRRQIAYYEAKNSELLTIIGSWSQ